MFQLLRGPGTDVSGQCPPFGATPEPSPFGSPMNPRDMAQAQPPPRGLPRKITINPVFNGWECKVGCQVLVFERTETLLKQLKDYLEFPAATESRWRGMALHADLLNEVPGAPPSDCGTQTSECRVERQRI